MTRRRPLALPLVALLLAGCASAATSSGTWTVTSTLGPAASVAPASTSPTASAPPSAGPSASAAPSGSPETSASPSASADVAVQTVLDGLTAPVGYVAAPDGGDRHYLVDQTGVIYVVEGGQRSARPFLDLRDRLVSLDREYDERGLLGLVFDPEYATTHRFFVYYSATLRDGAEPGMDHTDTLSSFEVDDSNADQVDTASERRILEFEQPQPNHSGGALGFGPDGFLYLGVGDGGGAGDASPGHSIQGNAQDLDKLNGKVLRLDVSDDRGYAIPRDNPFASSGGRPEIYAWGFRNPWRLSWEPAGERRLILSDVGYGRYEELDVVIKGGNYGWRIREGAHCLDVDHPLEEVTGCPTTGADGEPLIDPVVEYSHDDIGVAVVGGYRYHGSAIPGLRDQYVFADCSGDPNDDLGAPLGSLLVATPSDKDGATWEWRRLVVASGPLGRFVTGMAEDPDGELYLMTRRRLGPAGATGEVLKLVPPG
jgi:glucose/arabinose dehydrogenase